MVMTIKPRHEEELLLEEERKNENVWILYHASHLLFWSIFFVARSLASPSPSAIFQLLTRLRILRLRRQGELFFLYEVTARPPSIEWHDQGESASFSSSPLNTLPSALGLGSELQTVLQLKLDDTIKVVQLHLFCLSCSLPRQLQYIWA